MILRLHDNGKHLAFAPLTLTRPVGDLRMGILTNKQRWELLLPESTIRFDTEAYLEEKYKGSSEGIVVNACVIPTKELAERIGQLKGNEKLLCDGTWLAYSGTGEISIDYVGAAPVVLEKRWHLYQKNADVLKQDFETVTAGRTSVQLSSTNTIIGDPSLIFLEKGAKVEAAILNTTTGPIYIGHDAEIMEGSVVRGPLAMCNNSVLKLATKVYGPVTLGPFCKIGGEVGNSVFQAYSNKGHDGYLGDALIGEWCNLGADTNSSNLKNNYGLVKTYSFESKGLEQTTVQFMGLTMGDHSKCGINTMFNTATVVGVSSNVFGAEFPPKFVASFSWGVQGDAYDFSKALESANNMMGRRGLSLTTAEIDILRHIADNK